MHEDSPRESLYMAELNGRRYRSPARPVVVVCIDGSAPDYIQQGSRDGILPNIKRFMETGFNAEAEGVIPSFTNPNNLSIITGSPPSVHGISGNFFLDPKTGAEVMMNDPALLRSDTILAEFSRKGAKVAVITAKDKLLKLLSNGLGDGIRFSSEKADRCTLDENGIAGVLEYVGMPLPDVYSADLSLFVLRAGIRALERQSPNLMYLSLTDYIQHKYPPGTPEANSFYHSLDQAFGLLANAGALVALTADHGMNDKTNPDGSPKVIYLQEFLDHEYGPGRTKVICPITDPYVVHHGSLGSFVTVFCFNQAELTLITPLIDSLPGVERVLKRDLAAREFELPPDRIGDIIVIGDADTVIGSSRTNHDLSALKDAPLRSHGGLAEQRVPFILSRPLNEEYASIARARRLRNFDIFDFAINGTD